MKKFPWGSSSNIKLPFYSTGLLEQKRRYLSKEYKGFGRPRKTDYEYKSFIDIMFEIDSIVNLKIDKGLL